MIRSRFALTSLALLGVLAVASARGASPDARVALEAIRSHLDFLADDALEGRDTGTRGHDIAARYAAAQFRQWGLAPGSGDSYFQSVPLLEIRRTDSSMVAVHDGSSTPLLWKEDYLLAAQGGSDELAADADVVFAGFGIHAPEHGRDDYAGLDVDGKIVLVLGGAPPSFASEIRAHYSSRRQKRAEAARRGAIGILQVRTRDDEHRRPWSRLVLNAGRPSTTWRHPDGSPADDAPGLIFSAALSHDGARKLVAGSGTTLDELLDAGDSETPASRPLRAQLRVTARNELRELESPNVIALLPGADPRLRHELVLCTAHLDHVGIGAEVDGDSIYNGFYDNAMGSAMVLEMARVMAAAEIRPRRSVAFVLLTGEERGLLGSEYLAQHPSIAGATVVADLNIDMPLFLHPVADIVAFGAEHSTLGGQARAAAEANGFTLSPDPQPEESIFVRSDQYSFVQQGVPAIYLDTGWGSRRPDRSGKAAVDDFIERHYHRPSDEADLGADWDAVLRFTATNVALARAIADEDQRPRWLPDSFFGALFGGDGDAATVATEVP